MARSQMSENRQAIAVAISCFNRKDKTLASLAALFNQEPVGSVSLMVYLVDDGSTDGTGDAVSQAYPQVKIIPGDGNLFWNGGMRLAFAEALKSDYDYYLWLNDDTILYPDALKTLLATREHLAAQGQVKAIVAGSTQDPETGELTYGGYVQFGGLYPPFKCRPVPPGETAKLCDTMCGNVVLIPREVVQIIGNLDPALTHYAGDWDYGLRAKQQGGTVWVAPGYQGTCARNQLPAPGTAPDLAEGLKKIDRPKGLALQDVTLQPWEEWKLLMKRHGGILWPIFWLLPYRKLLWAIIFDRQSRDQ